MSGTGAEGKGGGEGPEPATPRAAGPAAASGEAAAGERSAYYRAIAGALFERRGGPFFLSPREIALVSSWEEAGIPLPVVVEGLERAFEARRPPERRRMTLASCEREVRRAFERHRDRLVGGRRASASPPPDKRADIRAAIERFLSAPPAGTEDLAALLTEALRILDAGAADEELERLDARVDALLLGRASAEDRQAARREILSEHRGLSARDLTAAADLRLLRAFRLKTGLPRLATFYY